MQQKTGKQLIEIRRSKLDNLRKLGVNPYPNSSEKQQTAEEAKRMMDEQVVVAGRLMSIRGHGKLYFMDLADESGKVQLMVSESILGEDFSLLEFLDIGDFIQSGGKVVKTIAGEISVQSNSLKILAKTLRPLPATWHGFKNVDERYRKRYVDFIMNPESKKVIENRSKIISEVRRVLDVRGFLEVETPTLQPVYGGANARPFTTHYNALKRDFYLKISDELYLKRLIIGGFEKVYEIDHDFRNEGIDATHNPEFTMMECYLAYADYNDMMKLTEELYEEVALKINGTTKVTYDGHEIDLKTPWERITMSDAIKKYLDVDVNELSDQDLIDEVEKRGLNVGKRGKTFNRGLTIASLFEEVEPHLVNPVFVTDFPKETTSLCKIHRENDNLIERFEPYIGGKEIGNAYTELNDPDLQRHFFEEEAKAKEMGDLETHPVDNAFLEAMEYGMPPTGGLGLGIDRMVMIITGMDSIRNVITFPMLKDKE